MLSRMLSLWTPLLLLLPFIPSGKAECVKPILDGHVVLTNEAILKNNFPDGSDITIECANGYEIDSGSDRMTCTDGTWSSVELICKKKDCGLPKVSPNMRYEITEGTLFGAYIKPVCDRGYELQGSSYRQCLARGWGGRSFCQLVECKTPPEIDNGMITMRPKKEYPVFEDIIEYSCNPSYILIGNKTISCEADGQYSSEPPQCIANDCKVPQIQFAVQIKGESHYTLNSEAMFKCQLGYSMKGSPSIVCKEHGWSEFPVCFKDISTTETNIETTAMLRMIITSTTPSTTLGTTSVNIEGWKDYLFPTIVILSIIAGGTVIAVCFALLHFAFKRKGSYDTGEALKTKEELIQKQSRNPVLI